MDPNDKRLQNLVPNSERTPIEREELARKAGIASGVARREQKSLKEKARIFGELRMKKGGGRDFEDMDAIEDIRNANLTGDEVVIASTWDAAKGKGNVPAKELWFKLRGALDPDISLSIPSSPILLGVMPADKVEKAKAEHEARQLEGLKKQ